ncbi:YicC/YloC family endoribonuclease [Dyadobacter sp. LHD-138]|uniref:YicC/YloC family endoribonuclease n=1 Tax=Dyadobacter sp. LHD-138 TaxID=3071413 RepID=UPI0027E18BEB|nr:YicC/YloC family endoribonuclease [Dyadobacter sp. LHD-138]MDQ6481493.1 YicC/YloC family endoribonuclease [Dyadobacter sp. LHD-138]
MLRSMTGYGVANIESESINVTVEIKTLNSKFLDIYCRVPRNYSEREIEIRNLVTQSLERGKVEVSLTVQPVGKAIATTAVNRPLVKAYFSDLSETANDLGFSGDSTELLRMALQLPNAYNTESVSETNRENDWAQIKEAVHEALRKCTIFREQEGKMTADKFVDYIGTITSLLEGVKEQDKLRIPAVRERLEKQVRDLLSDDNFDPNRFEQELIYYIEKFDISEEKIRLENHLNYFKETLQSPESNGKKLNFIAQEIGREINTIGSKANDSGIQRLVVQMKDELEKIKEQTMNII